MLSGNIFSCYLLLIVVGLIGNCTYASVSCIIYWDRSVYLETGFDCNANVQILYCSRVLTEFELFHGGGGLSEVLSTA
jgi:hypothetical protein